MCTAHCAANVTFHFILPITSEWAQFDKLAFDVNSIKFEGIFNDDNGIPKYHFRNWAQLALVAVMFDFFV